MAYLDMKAELAEAIPGMSRIYAGTLINRGWRIVRDAALWSFQLVPGAFSTPAQIVAGTVTTPTLPVPPVVIGDAAATAAWAALGLTPPITAFQFRIGDYSIYNVIGYDTTTYAPFAALTLDRPFVEAGGVITSPVGNNYQLFQAYYPVPSKTFKRWLSVQDVVNGFALDIWSGRRDVNVLDPQRQIQTNPGQALPLGQDKRVDATGTRYSTYGWPMTELWPVPTSALTYATWYVDRGADLVANTDELPEPISQEVVLTKAREYAYEWAESRADVMRPRGSGANYALLKKTARDDFNERLKTLRITDKDTCDATLAKINGANGGGGWGLQPFYNTVTGQASPGYPAGWWR